MSEHETSSGEDASLAGTLHDTAGGAGASAGDRTAPRGRIFPERVGPCLLVRSLGAGGMGAVYLARMAEDRAYARAGAEVAIKLIFPERLERRVAPERLRREAALGTRLRHPSVIETHELGSLEVDGSTVHFLVMEYVAGQTLKALLDDLGPLPEALARDLGAQVAQALAAVHEAGAVHRDVKPSNVLITPANQVKLMDLGIALLLEESTRLTHSGHFIGTPIYGAPEQFRGDPIGPATDLYALGVLLYELVTGSNPFRAPTPVEVMGRHLHHRPAKAGTLNPRLSPFLEELVDALLAKEAGERPGPAAELALTLLSGEASGWWRERERGVRARHPRGILRVVRSSPEVPLVGRQAELDALEQAFAEARNGNGRLVLIEGEAGVGKSRLIEELVRGLEERGEDAAVLLGSSPPAAQAAGADALALAIVTHFGEAGTESAMARLLAATPRLVPGFVAHLTGRPPPAGADPLRPDALHAAYCHLARALAGERPLVWVVEDLQFAPAEGRAVLASLARVAGGVPLLLIATTRKELPAADVAALTGIEGTRRIALARLDPDALRRLVVAAAGNESLADRIAPVVARKSDGNPFFALEMVRELREHGSDGYEVPSSVRDLLAARLAQLQPDERELIEIAAVQGFAFDPELVARAAGEKRLRVLRALAVVESRTGLVRGTAIGFEFDHHQLQEVVYATLPPLLAAEYHGLLARAYAELHGLDAASPEDVSADAAVFLAHHSLRARRSEQGLPHVPRALAALEASYQGDALLDLAALALAALGDRDPELRFHVRKSMSITLSRLGRRSEQRAAADDALAAAIAAADRRLEARARVNLVKLLVEMNDFTAADPAARAAAEIARDAGDPAMEAGALSYLAITLHRRARFEEALAVLEEVRRMARRHGLAESEISALNSLGSIHQDAGRQDLARECFEACLAIARARGDRLSESLAIGNLGVTFRRIGDYARARDCFERDLALSREVGHRLGEAKAQGNLGNVSRNAGDFAAAEAAFTRHLELSAEIGHRLGEAIARSNLGVVAVDRGRHADARRHLQHALEMWRALGVHHGEILARLTLAEAALDLGETDEAERHLGQAPAESRALGLRELEATAEQIAAELARAHGDRRAARACFERALAISREVESHERLAHAACAFGRFLADEDPARARVLLAEATGLVAAHALLVPGPVAAAWLACVGGADPAATTVTAAAPVLHRAEAHAVLALAGAGGHAARARALLSEVALNLEAGERERFWRRAPAALLLERAAGGDGPTTRAGQ